MRQNVVGIDEYPLKLNLQNFPSMANTCQNFTLMLFSSLFYLYLYKKVVKSNFKIMVFEQVGLKFMTEFLQLFPRI